MFNPITEGLLKAFGLISRAQPAPSKNGPKATISTETTMTAVHAARCLTAAERETLNDQLEVINEILMSGGDAKPYLDAISRKDIRLVPLKTLTRHDRSRYTGEKLREIRAAGGGAKEQARAARRAVITKLAA